MCARACVCFFLLGPALSQAIWTAAVLKTMRRLTAASPERCRMKPPCSSEWAGSVGDGCGSEGGWCWPAGKRSTIHWLRKECRRKSSLANKVKMERYHVQEFSEEDGSTYRNTIFTACDDFHQPLRTTRFRGGVSYTKERLLIFELNSHKNTPPPFLQCFLWSSARQIHGSRLPGQQQIGLHRNRFSPHKQYCLPVDYEEILAEFDKRLVRLESLPPFLTEQALHM